MGLDNGVALLIALKLINIGIIISEIMMKGQLFNVNITSINLRYKANNYCLLKLTQPKISINDVFNN